jgi:hypothetical protein
MANPPAVSGDRGVVTQYSKPRFPAMDTLEVGGPKFRPPVHRVHRYLSQASHADVTGSKSSNDREARASQRNDRSGACTFQMRSAPASEVLPENSARYAKLEENSPLDGHFQMNLSGSSDMFGWVREVSGGPDVGTRGG